MTPSDRAAAILAELAEAPEVAAIVAADIGNLQIAREWDDDGGQRGGMIRSAIVARGLPVAWVSRSRGQEWMWCVEDRPRLGGVSDSAEAGMLSADAELRRRGWRLL